MQKMGHFDLHFIVEIHKINFDCIVYTEGQIKYNATTDKTDCIDRPLRNTY
jgi:hypothetical protein